MRPGMNAGADIVEMKIPNAISIPAKALFTVSGKPAVYVKANGTVYREEGRDQGEKSGRGGDRGDRGGTDGGACGASGGE